MVLSIKNIKILNLVVWFPLITTVTVEQKKYGDGKAKQSLAKIFWSGFFFGGIAFLLQIAAGTIRPGVKIFYHPCKYLLTDFSMKNLWIMLLSQKISNL